MGSPAGPQSGLEAVSGKAPEDRITSTGWHAIFGGGKWIGDAGKECLVV
jgi:hypothetical protein